MDIFKCTIISALLASAVLSAGCGTVSGEKPKYLCFTADANFQRFSHKDSICHYLDKAVETGFNGIVVDVRGVNGFVLYESDFIPPLTKVHGTECVRDWDYLQFFIDEAHRRGLKVSVSTTVFPLGSPYWHEGAVYDNPELSKLTCVEYTPDGMMKIEDDREKVAAFMNPVLPESREYAMRMLKEIFSRYEFDGFCLDYCRFPDAESDFSEATKKAFEEYIGGKVEHFPEDIFTYAEDGSRIPGRHYKEWWEFRSTIIRDFIAGVAAMRDELQPDVELQYWAASWLHAIYTQGQNWASPEAKWYEAYLDEWATPEYGKTGFADLLDVFITGTYLERVWGMDDPESIEYGIARTFRDIDGDCTVYGSIYALNWKDFEDAVYVSLSRTSGLMVFDIVQVIEYDLWDEIRRGIDRAETEARMQ